jgi:hexosaminidase
MNKDPKVLPAIVSFSIGKLGLSIVVVVSFFAIIILSSCSSKPHQNSEVQESIPDMIALIPMPASATPGEGTFELKADAQIFVPKDHKLIADIAGQLAAQLRLASGYPLEIISGDHKGNGIVFSLNNPTKGLGKEGYNLVVKQQQVVLSADQPEGLFRGTQTIRQLLPPAIESAELQEGPWLMPVIDIEDRPRYGYRGSMLDVSRHFFSVEDVKRYIDLMALYKMNVLHLGLTNDQGWRIEIKSWPKLTAHGGSTEVGGGEGGFYSQEEYTDIVNYAAKKFVLIIPEIDMPGHTNAALASYAELNCDGKARDLYTGTEVGFSSFCIDKEITYQFIDDVIRELSAITPGPYIHIGADEAHSTEEADFIRFVNRVQDIVESHGKQVVGWEEVLRADIHPNTVVQYWNTKGEIQGFTPETKVIMSPASNSYLDMKYTDDTELGLNWAGNSDTKDSYEWDPVTLAEKISKSDILGVEAALWSETVENMEDIEFMIFPRLPGIAEIGWSPVAGRNWDEYKTRLAAHGKRFEALEVNYFQSPLVPWR